MKSNSPRFTLDGDQTLEAHLARTCQRVGQEVEKLIPPAKLEGVLLAGGYGRGEGGVLRTPSGDHPYNDMEFYVFVRGNAVLAERRFRTPLHELGEQLSPKAGLEVEFKALPLAKLRRSEVSMFYYDLVMGHRWVNGDEALLRGCEHHREAGQIPLHEATRLMMNRCSGLLYAAERLQRPQFGEAEADFVARNLAKARLAFGDVLLTAFGRYHWSCRKRHERLKTLGAEEIPPWTPALVAHHAAGVEFKLHPGSSRESQADLRSQHRELSALGAQLWFWLESRRLGITCDSARGYAFHPANKCPETSGWRNRLINARASGWRAMLSPSATRYPRERLFHSLCLLLWEPDALNDPALLEALQSWLQTGATDLSGLVAAYGQLWERFN